MEGFKQSDDVRLLTAICHLDGLTGPLTADLGRLQHALNGVRLSRLHGVCCRSLTLRLSLFLLAPYNRQDAGQYE